MSALAPLRVKAAIAAAVVAVALVLGSTAYMIGRSEAQARGSAAGQFRASTTVSAAFVSSVLGDRIDQEVSLARTYLATSVAPTTFERITGIFGLTSAVLVGRRGGVLAVARPGAATSGLGAAAERALRGAAGRPAPVVTDVRGDGGAGDLEIAIAVPFSTASGVRVLSGASVGDSAIMRRFVARTATSLAHPWSMLVDSAGRVVESSTDASFPTVRRLSPELATAILRHGAGSFTDPAGRSMAFASARVAGTRWRLVVAVPTSELYAGSGGLAAVAPWAVFAATALLASALTLVFARSLRDRRALRAFSLRMQQAAITDPLTGLPNRRAVEADLERISAGATPSGPHSLLMIDLDRFKDVNDTYGHGAGDDALRAVAAAMRAVLRRSDVFGRWGGDEFVAVLPGLGVDAASHVVARLRRSISAQTVHTPSASLNVAVSIGSATATSPAWGTLLADADSVLYREKAAKRRAASPERPLAASTSSGVAATLR